METLYLFVVLVILVALSATFSASETAYSSLNQIRLKAMVADGVKHADLALYNSENFDKTLTMVLIGNNIVNVASSALCTMLFSKFFGEAYGVVLATVFMITVLLIFGEVTPKTLAKRNPEKFAIRVATIIRYSSVILAPIIWAFLALTRSLSKGDDAEAPPLTEDELYVMIDEIEEGGAIEERERDLIKSAIQFDDTEVSEIFTPRVDLVATDIRTSVEDMKRLFIDSGFSRVPVFDGTVDRIVGMVPSKEFYSMYVRNEDFEITDIIRPVKFVPENESIATLLNEMQNSKVQMAIVLDEFGGTLGIVCVEDILEELVGEIWDEDDVITHPIVKEDDGTYLVLGDAEIGDIMDELGLTVDEDMDQNTVSGYIQYMLKRIPRKGDTFTDGPLTVTVKSMKSRRIKEAKFVLSAEAAVPRTERCL